jgi:hypothetical protein
VVRGVKQGCVISPVLLNIYSEFMVKEAMENVDGSNSMESIFQISRYADDMVLVAEGRKKLQKMIDKLNETCKAYGMEVNVKRLS